jgi:hypothetical protein
MAAQPVCVPRWRISVEDATGVQPYQELCLAASETSLQPHRIVAGVEDEERRSRTTLR